jgi:hypothetical protein
MHKKRTDERISSVLEEIPQAARRDLERASLERRVAAYYSSLSAQELAEQIEWGDFALGEFPGQEPA